MTAPLFELHGFIDRQDVLWYVGSAEEVNPLLSRQHYLGPVNTGSVQLVVVGTEQGRVVAAQVWKRPTNRHMPFGGSWLELSRWCLTPAAGENAGSRMHRYAVRLLRDRGVKTVISYSDPTAGHTGALYRACNWLWAPTWGRLRPPPSGGGTWDGITQQAVKDRWVFHVAKHDDQRHRQERGPRMTHSPNISEQALNGLHDHQIAQSRALVELEATVWWATDVLLTADDIFRRYGPPPAPGDEVRDLLACVRHFLLTVPPIDPELHKLPLPERPETPTPAAVGEDPAGVGTNLAPVFADPVDIHLDDDIAHAFDDLKTTDDYDGGAAA